MGLRIALLVAALSAAAQAQTGYAIGADLSFLKQQEDAGRSFKDKGNAKPGLRIFKDHGYGWVRLRLFHTPTALPNGLEYTVTMAKQAKAQGFRLLLDLHYSDTWADPGAQSPPKAWEGLSHAVLQDSVYRYTRAVLARFRAEGVAPDMVQIGNEINAGFLWPDGHSADFPRFADLLKAGIRGVDSASRGTARPKIMLHIACGGDTAATKWFFDNALAQAVPFDVIGQSYYPIWHGALNDLSRNLAMMGRRYAKDLFVVETAFAAYPDGTSPFPLTDAGQTDYVRTLDSLVRATPNGRGQGWLWWEPTADEYLGTPRGLFDKQGNARPALYAFDPSMEVARASRRVMVTRTLPTLFPTPTGPVRANGARAHRP